MCAISATIRVWTIQVLTNNYWLLTIDYWLLTIDYCLWHDYWLVTDHFQGSFEPVLKLQVAGIVINAFFHYIFRPVRFDMTFFDKFCLLKLLNGRLGRCIKVCVWSLTILVSNCYRGEGSDESTYLQTSVHCLGVSLRNVNETFKPPSLSLLSPRTVQIPWLLYFENSIIGPALFKLAFWLLSLTPLYEWFSDTLAQGVLYQRATHNFVTQRSMITWQTFVFKEKRAWTEQVRMSDGTTGCCSRTRLLYSCGPSPCCIGLSVPDVRVGTAHVHYC